MITLGWVQAILTGVAFVSALVAIETIVWSCPLTAIFACYGIAVLLVSIALVFWFSRRSKRVSN